MGYTVPDARMLRASLGQKLVPVVDGARDIATKLGLRPYVVRLVWTRWSEGARGEGSEIVAKTEVLTPIPKSPDLSDLSTVVGAGGEEEQGSIRVNGISGRYSENFLKGCDEEGNPPADDVSFYWEVEFPLAGSGKVVRRFSVRGVPVYLAGSLQWAVDLERVHAEGHGSGGGVL